MAKVTFEFDEFDDRRDINVIVNRHKLENALCDLSHLRRNLYKGYINDTIVVKDNEVVYKDGKALKEYDTENTEEYINTSNVINELDRILEDVYSIINEI